MKNNKKGVGLLSLVITVVVLGILITIIIMNVRDENIILRAEFVVSETRIRELEYAITQISSDYHLLYERDASVRNMTLKEYILKCLKEDYNLTSSEENSITIDENGYLSVAE